VKANRNDQNTLPEAGVEMNFAEAIAKEKLLLTEGSIMEKLRRQPLLNIDAELENASLIYDEAGEVELAEAYREYFNIGFAANTPFIAFTPTARATFERVQNSAYKRRDVNRDNVIFLDYVRKEYKNYAKKIFIGGTMSCRGAAGNRHQALDALAAFDFHRPQAISLAYSGVDFLFGSALSNLAEARGMAQAMSICDEVPYALSFILKSSGTLIDGTPLHETIATIDRETNRKPLFYMVCCIHPNGFKRAFALESAEDPSILKRVIGLQANASWKCTDELNYFETVEVERPEVFGGQMAEILRLHHLQILGGCCGTDARHIHEVAKATHNLVPA
jgi:homocysteine S-methyltransferase